MSRFSFLLLIILIFAMSSSMFAGETEGNWAAISKNIVRALDSDNEELKKSALHQIIQYGDSLSVDDAAYNIYCIYRWHENPKMRQLALVSLYKTKNSWAMYQILQNIKTEDSRILRNQMISIVMEYYNNKSKHNDNESYIVAVR